MKHSAKDIELASMKHAKDVIVDLLNTQADLLDACKTAERELQTVMQNTVSGQTLTAVQIAYGAIRAAIAKATGETP